jgi:glycosyltransferase involved in cell wall biosynthesis
VRIGFVTEYDARDLGQWSGIPRHVSLALGDAGASVEYVGPLEREWSSRVLVGRAMNRLRGRRRFRFERHPTIARGFGRQAGERLTATGAEVAFGAGTIPLAFLDFAGPIVFWTDATFDGLLDFYPEFTALERSTIENGHRLEAEALGRCSAAIYSSEWAARSAVHRYGADPAKVHVIPFGANLTSPPEDVVLEAVERRPRAELRLLFVGADWFRKGGDIAVAAAERLNAEGVRTEIGVVGPGPANGSSLPPWVRLHGFLDKRRDADAALLQELFLNAHALLLPARADCTPIAVCEAAAFGVPTVAAGVGGMDSLIVPGETGELLAPGAAPDAYARSLRALTAERGRYCDAAHAALAHHRDCLNWNTSARAVMDILRAQFN